MKKMTRKESSELARIPLFATVAATAIGVENAILPDDRSTTVQAEADIAKTRQRIALLKTKRLQAQSDTITLDTRDPILPIDVSIGGIPAPGAPLNITARASDMIALQENHIAEIRQQAKDYQPLVSAAVIVGLLATGMAAGMIGVYLSYLSLKLNDFHDTMGDMLYTKVNGLKHRRNKPAPTNRQKPQP